MPPELVSTTLDKSSLVMSFSEPLDASSVPVPSAFSVRIGHDTPVSPTLVKIHGDVVELTLPKPANPSTHRVTVSYNEPQRRALKDVAGNVFATFTNWVIEPPANEPPTFAFDGAIYREISENAPTRRSVGGPIAVDKPANRAVRYFLSGPGAALFSIDENAQLRLNDAGEAAIDFETTASYSLTVYVSDRIFVDDRRWRGGIDYFDDAAELVILVADVNELPVVIGPSMLGHPENATTAVAAFTAVDVDGDSIESWGVGGRNRQFFWISQQGLLYFNDEIDYEHAFLSNNATFEVEVRATDLEEIDFERNRHNQYGRHTVFVTVTDVDEPGSFSIERSKGWVDSLTALRASVFDPDVFEAGDKHPIEPGKEVPSRGSLADVTFTWQRSDDGLSDWVDAINPIDAGSASASTYLVGGEVDPLGLKLLRTTVSGNKLTLVYEEVLDSDSVPATDAYGITIAGATAEEPESVDIINDYTVELTLSASVANGATVAVTYVPGTQPVRDEDGVIEAAALTDLPVPWEFMQPDTPEGEMHPDAGKFLRARISYTDKFGEKELVTAPTRRIEVTAPMSNSDPAFSIDSNTRATAMSPTLLGATVSGDQLVLTYDRPLDSVSVPAKEAYGITIDGATAVEPTRVAVNSKTVVLTLSAPVAADDDVTLDYTVPSVDPVRDTLMPSNSAVALTGQEVPWSAGASVDLETTRTVSAGSVAGRLVGAPVTATDEDDDSLTYRLVGTDGSSFAIDADTGQIRTKALLPPPEPEEEAPTYNVTVEVYDSFNSEYGPNVDYNTDASIDVKITVTDALPNAFPGPSNAPPSSNRPTGGSGTTGGGSGSTGGSTGTGSTGGSTGGGGGGGGGGSGELDVGIATFVVANGWSAADVGVASVLAARTSNAVVLYTAGGDLSEETRVLLRDASPTEVIIVGGTAAVSRDVRTQMAAASPESDLSRVTGADRVATAAGAARRVLGDPSSSGSVTLIVANGWSPPDIGAAAALAASSGRAAVAYVTAGNLPEATASLLGDYEVARVIVVGGTAAISAGVHDAIAAAAGGASISRLTGADRVDTAGQAARRVLGDAAAAPDGVTLVVANGWSPPDVGVAAALAAVTDNAAVVYTAGGALSDGTAALIREYRVGQVIIIGGRAAISDAVRAAISDAAPDEASIRRVTGTTRTHTAANAARRILRDQ